MFTFSNHTEERQEPREDDAADDVWLYGIIHGHETDTAFDACGRFVGCKCVRCHRAGERTAEADRRRQCRCAVASGEAVGTWWGQTPRNCCKPPFCVFGDRPPKKLIRALAFGIS